MSDRNDFSTLPPDYQEEPQSEMPHSFEAEQATIGCIFHDPAMALGEAVQIIETPKAMYSPKHLKIYDVLLGMYEREETIDMVTLTQELRDIGEYDNCGGAEYLKILRDSVPSAANIKVYSKIIAEKWGRRKMIRGCTDIIQASYASEEDLDSLSDMAEKTIMAASPKVAVEEKKIKDLVHAAIDKIQQYHENQGQVIGIPTGFSDLDKATMGFQNGDMIIIAARPSVGKTSLAMQFAEYVSMQCKLPVGVFSLEMTAESLVMRMLCSIARVNIRNVVDGFLAERDFPKITGAAGRIAGAPLFIDDMSGMTILQLKAKARRMVKDHNIKFLVVDYLQLLSSSNRRAENRQQEIADISSGLKGLAKELNIPVVVLAQLNRDLERRDPGSKPRLSDLRESGSLEQDGDLILLLYKPEQKKEDEQEEYCETERVNALIAKQRNGPKQIDIELLFLKSFTRFEQLSKVGEYVEPKQKEML